MEPEDEQQQLQCNLPGTKNKVGLSLSLTLPLSLSLSHTHTHTHSLSLSLSYVNIILHLFFSLVFPLDSPTALFRLIQIPTSHCFYPISNPGSICLAWSESWWYGVLTLCPAVYTADGSAQSIWCHRSCISPRGHRWEALAVWASPVSSKYMHLLLTCQSPTYLLLSLSIYFFFFFFSLSLPPFFFLYLPLFLPPPLPFFFL